MTQGYQICDQNAPYYLTFQVVNWVDIFTRTEYKDIIVNSFEFCRLNKGLELFAFVVMTNHIHLVARSKEGFRLSDTIRDFKKFTANRLLELIKLPLESRNDWMLKRFEFAANRHKRNSVYQIWTHENHAVELCSVEFAKQKIDYIHQNPVRAGIVNRAENYLYSSASNYSDLGGKIEIDFL